MDHFFNALLNLLQYWFCGLCSFFFFPTTRHLSSLTRDQTHTAALKGQVLTTGPPTKSLNSWWSSLMIILYWLKFIMLGDVVVVVVQLPSHVWLFTTPWNCSTPGFWCYCPKLGSLVSTGQISFQNSRGIWDHLIVKSKVDVTDKNLPQEWQPG